MLTRFKIVFKSFKDGDDKKKRRKNEEREHDVAIIYGNNYYLSDKDSYGYTRFVIIEYDDNSKKIHKFACNANDFLYVQLDLVNKDDES